MFSPKVSLPGRYPTSSIAVGDLDGDGKPDLASSRIGGHVAIFKNNSLPGSFTFDTGTYYLFIGGNITIADMNADGRNDLIAVDPNAILLIWPLLEINSAVSSPFVLVEVIH